MLKKIDDLLLEVIGALLLDEVDLEDVLEAFPPTLSIHFWCAFAAVSEGPQISAIVTLLRLVRA